MPKRIKATPSIDPRTAPRIFTGNAGLPEALLAVADDDDAVDVADAVEAVVEVADPKPACADTWAFDTNFAVALTQQLSLALNIQRTSSSFPPEIGRAHV